MKDKQLKHLNTRTIQTVLSQTDSMAKNALRVLAFAYKEVDKKDLLDKIFKKKEVRFRIVLVCVLVNETWVVEGIYSFHLVLH